MIFIMFSQEAFYILLFLIKNFYNSYLEVGEQEDVVQIQPGESVREAPS
jgi:hypothetical protein